MAEQAQDRAEIGRRVLRLRTELGLTQRALAEPEYTAAYISTLESGKVRPSETALRFLAERLGVSFEELSTGQPAHLATDLRMRLTDARQTLCSGARQDAEQQYAVLAAEARALALPAEEAAALVGLGDCATETGDLDQAIAHFRAAEELLADAPLPQRVPAVRGRAVAHLLAGDLRYSCYLLETAIDQLNAGGLHDPNALLLLYSAVIAPYLDMGAQARAAQAAELALALAPQVTDPALVARMHRGVARTLRPPAGPPRRTPRWPGPRSCTSSSRSAPNSPTATGCAATSALSAATWPRPSTSCGPRAASSRTAGPPSTPSRSTWNSPTCCAARADRTRPGSFSRAWSANSAPRAAPSTRAPPTGCSG